MSPSYFPLTAAVELGFFIAEGLDAEFIFPPVDPGRVLVDGDVDFYGASPYVAFECLSEWRGGKILCALSQYTYWFLAVRADLGAVRGDMSALKGLRISASGQPGILLRKLLVDSGLDFERDKVQVVPAPRPPEGLDNLFEPPASEHLMSENASAAEPASLLAVFVADDGARLTVPSTP